MIKMQIIGRLGKDCIVNTVNGKNVINFSLAHSEKFKDSQGAMQEKTIWVDCAYWTDRTAVAQYLTKGTQVYADGQPELKTFQRNDGTPGTSLSLRVREVQLLGGRADNAGGAPAYNTATADAGSSSSPNIPAPSEVTEPIDDLPF
jgi:single-strand DNA-binding protein